MKKAGMKNRTGRNRAGGLVLAFAALLSGGMAAWARQAPSQDSGQQSRSQAAGVPEKQPETSQTSVTSKIAVDVKTVSVAATVRDKHGKIISDLKKEDFAVDEDGKPQTINYFARENDMPLRLGLLVDTSLSQRRVLEQERTASYSFLDQMLRSKDLAFVIHFDRDVELLEDFTGARPKLQAALQSLQTPQFDAGNGGGGGQSGGGSQGGGMGGGGIGGGRRGGGSGRGGYGRGAGTLLYDAVYLAGDELMSKQKGRKAVIILSDGVDHGSREGLATAIETAQRSDTVVYSILFKDDEGYGGRGGGVMMGPVGMGRRGGGRPREERPDGKKILEQISRETGGRMFEVSKKETVEKIYAQIEEELRNQYSLGYTPGKDAGAGYHKLHVTVKGKDLVVQARDGYYLGQ
jgi:VWFA-related protein